MFTFLGAITHYLLANSSNPTIAETRPRHTGHWKDQVDDVILAQVLHKHTCLQWRMATSRGFDRQITQSPPSESIPRVSPTVLSCCLGLGSVPYKASTSRTDVTHFACCLTTCREFPSPNLKKYRCAAIVLLSAESTRRSNTS